jgi:hypothetical protein
MMRRQRRLAPIESYAEMVGRAAVPKLKVVGGQG